MEFHHDKCFVLRVTNKRKCIDADYSIHDQILERVGHANFLGVTISKDLSWKKNVQRITTKATNTRLFLQRNLTFSDSETRLMCYKTYVRPIVEYASSVWDPVGNNTLVEKIESIQRKSLRWIHNIWMSTVSPTALRKVLEISTLESRRSSARLKMMFDLLYKNKHINTNCLLSRQRWLNVKFKPIFSSIKAYENFFLPQVIKMWNNLTTKISNETNEYLSLSKIRKLES